MIITVNQILRPVKLAFLIQPNRKASYVRALQVCSSLWGGKHFPILPYYKKFSEQYTTEYHIFATKPPEYYKNILDNFDPDFIVIDKGIDPARSKRLNQTGRSSILKRSKKALPTMKQSMGYPFMKFWKQ